MVERISRISRWHVAVVVTLLAVVAGAHVVRAQGSGPSPMPATLLNALAQSEPDQQSILPDGRTLVLSNTHATAVVVDDTARHAPSLPLALPGARRFATATVMPDGRVLIWGGLDASGQVVQAGLWFDPATNAVTPATHVSLQPRAGQTVTVLSDGRVLVTGGWSPRLGSMPEAELWDPRSGQTQIATSLLQPPRMGHSATLRADGRVALNGGLDATGSTSSAAALFDPASEQFQTVNAALLVTPNAGLAVPALAASYPTSGTQNFPAGGMLMLRFSVPMDVRSINADTITLLGPGGGVPVRVVAAENGRLAFITPTTDLFTGSHYTLFVQRARSATHRAMAFTAIDFSTASLQSATPVATTGTGATGANPKGTSQPAPQNVSLPKSGASVAMPASPSNSDRTASAGSPPLRLMTGFGAVDKPFLLWSSIPSCGVFQGARLALCRAQGVLDQGGWSPGQDAAGGPGNGHWRLNKPDMTPKEIAAAALAQRTKGGSGPSGVSGRVELVDGQPITHVDVSIGTVHVQTDASGKFSLVGVPTGHQWLYVDGTTANTAGREYGQFVVGVDIRSGVVLPLSYRTYLPRIRLQDKITIPSPTTQDLVITHPEMPGLEIHIPAGTVIKDHKGKVVTELSIVPTPVDRAPFPTAQNFPVYFSIEPSGATVQNLNPKAVQGLQIVYPNYGHLAPKTQADFYVYQPDDGWKVYGKAHVTADGTQVMPEAGVNLVWVMGGSFSITNTHPPVTPQTPVCGCTGGDPVDLFTGIFGESQTDIQINDIIPIALSRVNKGVGANYINVGDQASFGTWRSNYELYLYSSDGTFNSMSLRTPDGNAMTFNAVAPLAGDAFTWTYTGSPSPWNGARLEAIRSWTDYSPRCGGISECYLLTLKDGTQYQFNHEIPNELNLVRDRFGNQVTLTYNAGLLQQITSPSGRYIALGYNANNTIATATDPANKVWSYAYTAMPFVGSFVIQALKTVTYPDSVAQSDTQNFTYVNGSPYDGNWGGLLTIVDRNGHTALTNVYATYTSGGVVHPFGSIAQQVLADGKTYTFNHPATSQPGTVEADVTDPNGHVNQTFMDSTSGYPVTEVQAAGTPQSRTTTYIREPNGLVDSMTEPLTATTTRTTNFQYDAKGNVKYVQRVSGTTSTVQQFTYTQDFNQIATSKDGLWNTTIYNYTNGCLTTVTDPLGHATTGTCNASGQPLTVTDANGNTTTFAYLGYDLRTVTDALNRTVTYTTDVLGHVVATADTMGHLSRREFDSNDRVSKVVDPLNQATTFAYDNNGNLLSVLLPNTGLVGYVYDIRNRLQKRIDALQINALPLYESWTYDNLDHVLTHTDRNGQITTLVNDPLDRPSLITFGDLSTITPTFDAGNRLRTLADSQNGTQSFNYDGLDRLTQAIDAQSKAVNYTYDAANRRQTMIPAAQPTVSYSYDNANRITGIMQGTETVGFGYDNANRRNLTTLPNGVTTTYGYDNANQLTGITYKKSTGSTLGALVYAYDKAGRRTSQTGTYASNNLPAATTPATPSTFDLNNRQTSFNGAVLTYDRNGNLLNDGTRTYVWNARNQLTQIKTGTTVTASFSYDATGRRISKTEGGQTVGYLYDGANAVQETIGSTVNPILTGLGVDERFARNDTSSNVRTYFLTDALGSTRALTSTTGAILDRYDYDPYGNGTQSATGYTNPYQYTGREHDQSGMYFNRARYYQPAMGRFIAADPIGFGGGLNAYAYVGGNPISYHDLLGLILDINDFPTNQAIHGYADHIPSTPGAITVGGHGSPTVFQGPTGIDISPADLAAQIKAVHGYHSGQHVILYSCETGASAGWFSSDYAQQLADALGDDDVVSAPNNTLWIYPNGNTAVGPSLGNLNGGWVPFYGSSFGAPGW